MQKKTPNFLILMSDQHRYDCVGFSEKYPVKTPNLDRLASESVWFEQAYCTIPTCCPARQSFISGKRPERFGAHWNYDITMKVMDLPVSEFSYARALKEAGYQTAYVGKWHVSGSHTPLEYGFDEYYGIEHFDEYRKAKGNKGNWECHEEKGIYCILGGASDTPFHEAGPHHLASKAIEILEELKQSKDPFCLVLSIEEPHLPCCPSEPFASLFTKEDVIKWGGFEDTFEDKPYIQKQMTRNWTLEELSWNEWSECVANYYGSIAQMDDAMGTILAAVQKNNLEEDTVIIYTSDHGDMCGSHRMIDKHYVMYDDVVRVPLMIKWKNQFVARKCGDFVHNFLDLHSTVLELAGVNGDEVCDGKSLLSQLQGKDEGREYALSTYNGQQFGLYNQRMLRNAHYKYIWNLTDVDEFYDLKRDPYELCNEIHNPSYKDVIASMRKQLYAELEKCDDALVNDIGAVVQLLNGNKI